MIVGSFSNRNKVTVYVGPGAVIYAVFTEGHGHQITREVDLRRLLIPPISIQPQIGPLNSKERVLNIEYVRDSMPTTRASIHFRNELYLDKRSFDKFKELTENTWRGLRVLELRMGDDGALSLLIQDRDFVAEIGRMGHGVQMWLQTMWFLAHAPGSGIVVLDEPDVYMHADLQRKLIRVLMGKYRQVLVSTHSAEIMAEVSPESVLVLDSGKEESRFATSLPAVQRVVESMGGVHNLQLTRLWSAQKCLLVEGDDLYLLKRFQSTLFPESPSPLDNIPNWPIGGWGGWNYAIGSRLLLKNAYDENIRVYCVLDRDYHTQGDIDERRRKATELGIFLHVWARKEIENYLLVPSAISRAICEVLSPDSRGPTADDVSRTLLEITEALKDSAQDAIGQEYLDRKQAKNLGEANKIARKMISGVWDTLEGRLTVVSGKSILTRLFDWSQRIHGVSLTPGGIAAAMLCEEIPSEMVEVVTMIENGDSQA